MKRRRFLQILACSCASPSHASAPDWQGQGFGADLSLHLAGKGNRGAALKALPRLIAQLEADFSLFDPNSALSRLNRTGQLSPVSSQFQTLVEWSDVLHHMTQGSFDPTVQALWLAHASGGGQAQLGWTRVNKNTPLTLPAGMSLTFNGLAQGFAADCVRQLLADCGYDQALVDMGEHAALGGPWRIGVSDPQAGLLAQRHLRDGAIATSSPFATLVNGQPHLVHPKGLAPLWSTVSVEATSATLADGLSTAAVFLTAPFLARIMAQQPTIRHIQLVDFSGNLQTVQPEPSQITP
jgi:FAD:protein FMN transferase